MQFSIESAFTVVDQGWFNELFARPVSGAARPAFSFRKSAVGRALMTNPEPLIFHEASEGLAPLIRDQIRDCLAQLRGAGQAILIVDKSEGGDHRL
jgi:ABC-type branched-subunit amino acid transport system ATPase component